MEKLKQIWDEYKGAIIGCLIALVILFTEIYKLIIGIILIVIGGIAGNYIQRNKLSIKDKLKRIIDKM